MPTQDKSPALRRINSVCRLVGFAIAIAIVIGGILVDQLMARWREDMTDRRRAVEAVTAQAAAAEVERDSLMERRTDAIRTLTAMQNRLTKTPQESLFNALLAEAAAASGMKIESFRPGQRTDAQSLGELDVQISCRGTYVAHCDFLDRLRSFSRACPVGGMKLTAADDNGSELQSEFQIRLVYGDAGREVSLDTPGGAR